MEIEGREEMSVAGPMNGPVTVALSPTTIETLAYWAYRLGMTVKWAGSVLLLLNLIDFGYESFTEEATDPDAVVAFGQAFLQFAGFLLGSGILLMYITAGDALASAGEDFETFRRAAGSNDATFESGLKHLSRTFRTFLLAIAIQLAIIGAIMLFGLIGMGVIAGLLWSAS